MFTTFLLINAKSASKAWTAATATALGVLLGVGVSSWRAGDGTPYVHGFGTEVQDVKAAHQPGKGAPASQDTVKTYHGQFNGVIGRTFDQSVPAWPEPLRASPGSPNVIFIVLDDVGFGQLGCYGGLCRTPNLDRLAKNGLRYNNFHATPMCSPTRSCVLTGRNHHKNGMASVVDIATGFPGYNGRIPPQNGFLSEILVRFGYATFAVGKWHLTPMDEMNMAASRANWPLGRGFERFHGFLGGHTHQFYPVLVTDNQPVAPNKTPEQGYHLTEDITNKAIEYVRDLRSISPEKPFFLYYAPGAMHSPHHVPREWIAKHEGRFDLGWDKARETILANQIKMGIVPEGTRLPPRPESVKAWGSLSDQERKLFSYMMEIYAAFLEHTDHHIGRLLDYLTATGQLDNTFIAVLSDNGASPEGGPNGLLSESSPNNDLEESVDYLWANKDKLGTPESYNHYPFGWTMAGCTPFKKWKRETHLGGIRDPLLVHWPKGIKERNTIRRQYVHAIDLAPTVLDLLGIAPPAQINGVTQSAFDGVSFKHTFDDPGAKSKRTTQYYEMLGCRAIYHDGWTAVAPNLPLGTPITEERLAGLKWELYHTDADFSQQENLADKLPGKVKMMDQLWWAEAARNNVLPLDGRGELRLRDPRPRIAPRTKYECFQGAAAITTVVAAPTINRSYKIRADLVLPNAGAEGVILAHGGNFGGWSLYVQGGKLRYTYNWVGRELYDIVSEIRLPAGKVSVAFEFKKTGTERFGAGGTGTLSVNGNVVGTKEIAKTNPLTYFPNAEGLTCGYDHLTPVTPAYRTPFSFTGTIIGAVIDVGDDAVSVPKKQSRD